MRILIVTQYYLPETGAPQNRLSGLAREFSKSGVEVVVLAAMPNYPRMKIFESYLGKFSCIEQMDSIQVYRSWIYASTNRSILSRLFNYFSFVFTSFIVAFRIKGRFDFVICESPPLFLGISAYFISKLKHARFIFNVSDLWPESAEKLGLVTNRLFLGLAYKLESWLYRKSVFVSGQTQGICKDIERRFPLVKTHWLPNGIDPERFAITLNDGWRTKNFFKKSDFILLYAGIIGHAQGLETILHAAHLLKDQPEIKFVILGDGPEKAGMIRLSETLKLSNVYFFTPVEAGRMPEVIFSCDAAIVPLKKLELFRGAIPSKIFENLALKKPIILGVEGEAKELFIDKGNSGLFFQPENANDLAEKIVLLKNDPGMAEKLGNNGYAYVHAHFDRRKIAENFLIKAGESLS